MSGDNPQQTTESTDRSVFLYEYSRYVYGETVGRFGRIDHKSSVMLSTIVIVIGLVFGLGSEWIYADFSDATSWAFSALSWLFAATVLVCAGFAIGYAMKALRVSIVKTPPLTDEAVEYIIERSIVDSRSGAARTLLEAHTDMTSQLDSKGRHHVRCVGWTIGLLGSSALAFIASMLRSVILP